MLRVAMFLGNELNEIEKAKNAAQNADIAMTVYR